MTADPRTPQTAAGRLHDYLHNEGVWLDEDHAWHLRVCEGAEAAGSFALMRDEDATGISGTGRVAQGFVFDDGTVALRWLSEHRSTAIYASLDEVEAIHGHNGSTRIEAEAGAAPALDWRRWLRDDKCWVHHDEDCQQCPRYWIRSEAAAAPDSLREALERLADRYAEDWGEGADESEEYRQARAALAAPADKASEPPSSPTRAMYGRLAAAYESEPTVPDRRGGVRGDKYPLEPPRAVELLRALVDEARFVAQAFMFDDDDPLVKAADDAAAFLQDSAGADPPAAGLDVRLRALLGVADPDCPCYACEEIRGLLLLSKNKSEG